MPYVKRDSAGAVIAAYANEDDAQQGGAAEWLEPTDPALLALIGHGEAADARLAASDLEMVRVIEDLIDILVEKNIVTVTEFPAAAQAKLATRQRLRGNMAKLQGLFEDDGLI